MPEERVVKGLASSFDPLKPFITPPSPSIPYVHSEPLTINPLARPFTEAIGKIEERQLIEKDILLKLICDQIIKGKNIDDIVRFVSDNYYPVLKKEE